MKILNNFFSALLMACSVAIGSQFSASAQDYPQKTNLPTVYIETQNGQSITSKENYVKATLRYVDAEGEKYYDALGIIPGSSSSGAGGYLDMMLMASSASGMRFLCPVFRAVVSSMSPSRLDRLKAIASEKRSPVKQQNTNTSLVRSMA